MHLLAESELTTSSSPAILTEYIWFNDHPAAQSDTSGATSWTSTDHLGTPFLQTSAQQAVTWRAEYEPYGAVYRLRSADQHQPLRLQGQESEQLGMGANGLTDRSYNIHRWYHFLIGRYEGPDPLWNPKRRRDLNPYLFAGANPTLLGDPLGLATWDCTIKVGGGQFPAPIGIAAAAIQVDCVSRCQCLRKTRVHLTGILAGGGAGIPFSGTTSYNTLDDDEACPVAGNLSGIAGILSASAATPWFGASCSAVQLGEASGGGCSGAKGVAFGVDALVGFTYVRDSYDGPCCGDPAK
jgi:RHS repeat-associated protein